MVEDGRDCNHDWRRVAFAETKLLPSEIEWLCLRCETQRVTSQWREAHEVEKYGWAPGEKHEVA